MITKDEYINLFNFINKRFSELIENIDLRELENKKNNLEKESQESDFWNDNAKAKKVLKLISNIEKELLEYKNLEIYHEEVSDDLELINLNRLIAFFISPNSYRLIQSRNEYFTIANSTRMGGLLYSFNATF